jgi:hypothetical protein
MRALKWQYVIIKHELEMYGNFNFVNIIITVSDETQLRFHQR